MINTCCSWSLQTVDSIFLQYLVGKTLEKSASVHLLFAFEYVILASAIISTFLKYTLSMIDAWMEVSCARPWSRSSPLARWTLFPTSWKVVDLW